MQKAAVPSLLELKALIQTKTQREFTPCPALPCGIPKGAITAIFGPGKTEFALQFIAHHPDLVHHPHLKIAWIEEQFSAFPFGFYQRKIQPGRILFIDAATEIFWATLQVLRAQVFPVVVFYSADCELNTLRRIQLETERSNRTTLWLAPSMPSLWPISLGIEIEKTQGGLLKPSVVRQRC